jgi:hypothetical protein
MEWRCHEARVTKVNVQPFIKYTTFLDCVLVRDLPTFKSAVMESNIYPNAQEPPMSQLGLPSVMGIWSSGMILA